MVYGGTECRAGYALDRIQELVPTGHIYVLPRDFDPETYFYNCFGIIKDDNTPAETIRIKVRNNQDKFVRSLPLHHSQRELPSDSPDCAIFQYYLSPTYDFRQEILLHGADFEVLEPAHLREEIKAIAKEMAGNYSIAE